MLPNKQYKINHHPQSHPIPIPHHNNTLIAIFDLTKTHTNANLLRLKRIFPFRIFVGVIFADKEQKTFHAKI